MLKSKRSILITLALLSILTLSMNSWAQTRGARIASKTAAPEAPLDTLMGEDFQYSTGQLTAVSGGNWIDNGGTAPLNVTAGSLTYPLYAGSGNGNKITLTALLTSAQDVYRQFATQTTGTVYAAMLIRVTSTTNLAANTDTIGDYFSGFIASNSTTTHVSRIVAKQGTTAGTYQLGIRGNSTGTTSSVFSPVDIPINTTHLIVFSYQINGAVGTDDVVSLYVDPPVTSSPPAIPQATQTGFSDATNIARIFFRQGTTGSPATSSQPDVDIDGVRVATTWSQAVVVNTASGVTVSGRVLSRDGRGITNAAVMISGENLPQPRAMYTRRNGSFSFDGIEAGHTYVITVGARRYTFTNSSRVIAVSDNVTNADFTADQ